MPYARDYVHDALRHA